MRRFFEEKMMRKSIIQLILAVIYTGYSFFGYYGNSVVKEYMIQELGAGEDAYSMISGALLLAFVVMQIPAGILLDGKGTKVTLLITGLLQVTGYMIMMISDSAEIMAAAKFLQGAGCAAALLIAGKVCLQCSSGKVYGILTGIVFCATSAGGIMAQYPLSCLLKVISWRRFYAWYTAGLFLLFILLVTVLPRNRTENRKRISLKFHRNIWLASGTCFFLFGGYGVITGVYGIEMLRETYQWETTEASGIMGIAIAGCCAGNIILGALNTLCKNKKRLQAAVIAAYIIVIAGICLELLEQRQEEISLLFFLYGFLECGYLTSYILAQKYADAAEIGTVNALINMACYLGSVIALLLISGLHKAFELRTGGLTVTVTLGMGIMALVSVMKIKPDLKE